MQPIYGERERAAYRRARRGEVLRELAPAVTLGGLLIWLIVSSEAFARLLIAAGVGQ